MDLAFHSDHHRRRVAYSSDINSGPVEPIKVRQRTRCALKLGFFTKLFRFTDFKLWTPFHIEIRTPEGAKVFSIGGKFDVLDSRRKPVFTLKGKWTRWNFQFFQGNTELASVSKKWAGLAKEMFTTADDYLLSINNAAGMCIDMVLKESASA